MTSRVVTPELRSRTWLSAVALLLALVSSGRIALGAEPGTNAAAKKLYQLKVTTDRPDALYSKSEAVRFTITLACDGRSVDGQTVQWTTTKDGVPPRREGSATLTNGTAEVSATLDEPGFLLCRAEFKTETGETVSALAGAGIDPLKIKPSLPSPDDFDGFWAAQRRLLAEVKFEPYLTPLSRDTSGPVTIESYDLQLPSVGAPVSGYYSRPVGVAPAPEAALGSVRSNRYPAILLVHGAGVRSSDLNSTIHWAREGFIALDINAHGLPNGRPPEFYSGLSETSLKGYPTRGREDRETVYFRDMFLRLIRAIDFLVAQPVWNGRTLVVRGSSQGGAQAIAAAGLDPRVTFFAALVPAMCDHSGPVAGRVAGWPKLVPVNAEGTLDPAILQVARYYDMMNFAAKAKAPGYFTVGFIDTTCPPSTVYATYNALQTPKAIFNDPPSRHENTPASVKAVTEAILHHARR